MCIVTILADCVSLWYLGQRNWCCHVGAPAILWIVSTEQSCPNTLNFTVYFQHLWHCDKPTSCFFSHLLTHCHHLWGWFLPENVVRISAGSGNLYLSCRHCVGEAPHKPRRATLTYEAVWYMCKRIFKSLKNTAFGNIKKQA